MCICSIMAMVISFFDDKKVHFMKKTFYYACVSIENREQQIAQFHSLGASDDEIYIDIEKDKPAARVNLNLLKRAALREGDTLVIPSLGCMSDSEHGIRDELDWINSNAIWLKILDIPATMADYPGQEARVAQLTTELLLEFYDVAILKKKADRKKRQTEGISAARAKGVRFGRPPMKRDPKFEQLKKQWENGEISLREGGRQLGVTHKTFQKWVTEKHKQ